MFRLIAFSMLLLYLFACDSSGDSANSSEMAVCNPSEKRCYGEFVQSCNLLGQWEDIPCPEGYSCFLVNNEPSCEDRNHGGSMPKADMTMSENQDISIPIDMIVGGNQGGSYADMTVVEDTGTTTAGTTAGTPAGSEGGTPAGSEGGTPAGTEGGAPAGSEGGTPAGTEGGAPAGSEGGTPAGTEGGAPAGSEGGTPAGTEGGAPAGSEGGTPAGTEGGAPAGSEGGTPAGSEGGTPAGIDGGSNGILNCVGTFCPSSRISSMIVPQNAEDAMNNGCNVVGSAKGSSLQSFLSLSDSGDTFNSSVQPNDNGEIKWILLAYLYGLERGNIGNNLAVDLQFFNGVQSINNNHFLIDPISFIPGTLNPLVHFDQTNISNQRLVTQKGTFTLISSFMGIPVHFTLSQASVYGDLNLDNTGFNLTSGIINGYLTRDSFREMLQEIITICASSNASLICNNINSLGIDIISLENLFESILYYDVAIAQNQIPQDCQLSGLPCNAMSVCFLIEMSSTTIDGIQ